MKRTQRIKIIAIAVLISAGAVFYQGANAQQQQEPKHPPVPAGPDDGKEMVVQLCDGETHTRVKGVSPDERLTPEQAQAVSNELMQMWLSKTDPAKAAAWKNEQAAAKTPQTKAPVKKPAGSKSQAAAKTAGRDGQSNDFNDRDFSTWKRELDREIKYGDEIFHSDKLIGSTNGIACAMCHPNAANTHPETYPKFQIQLRRVALLRDMINWCIEQPARGKKLDPDDPKMRALEAYIMSQRKGVPMEFGKH